MPRLIICTTGTSIAGRYPKDDKLGIRKRIKEIQEQVESDHDFIKQVSAETNSLLALNALPEDNIFFLHTDTDDGQICAELVAEVAEKNMRLNIYLKRIPGLQVNDALKFRREGIPALFLELNQLTDNSSCNNREVLLNCTGGFKGVVPYFTLYGLIKNFTTTYLFQFSDNLISLPPVPVSFDYDRLMRALPALEQIDKNSAITLEEFFSHITNLEYYEREWFQTLIEEVDKNNYTMSPLALMFWDELKSAEETVWLSENARKSLENASGSTKKQYNFYLSRVTNPFWRKEKRHAFKGTDLEVYKMGNTSERLAGFTENHNFYACELLQHDQYESKLQKCSKSDYSVNNFSPWNPTEEDAHLTEDDMVQIILKEQKELTKRISEKKGKISDLKNRIQNNKKRFQETEEQWKNKLHDQSEKISSLEGLLSEKQDANRELAKDNEKINNSLNTALKSFNDLKNKSYNFQNELEEKCTVVAALEAENEKLKIEIKESQNITIGKMIKKLFTSKKGL